MHPSSIFPTPLSRAVPVAEPREATHARLLQLLDEARALAAADPTLCEATLQAMLRPWTEAMRIRLVLLVAARTTPSLQMFARARERRGEARA